MISIIEGYIESWVKNRSSLKKQSSWRQRKLWLIFNDICKHNFALKRQCCLVVVVVLFWVCNKQHNKNQSAVITFIYLLLNISFKDQKLSISLYKLWVKVVGCCVAEGWSRTRRIKIINIWWFMLENFYSQRREL